MPKTCTHSYACAPACDPCVIDVFLSIVRFMEGEAPQPWWAFSKERKALLASEAPLSLG
ncbi:mitomycin resistance protein [Xanthomonas fragariae]|uniref:Mitomycin resistance protein n=1 Tax=Xanthomonas fragariae TaxID=48664 RepID=A0A1Y6H1V2_9XANT|nr:Pathogenicity locus [Xanthomonas fragariae]SMR05049.1 mitomycin resistance protein [Xanthomonas fragariae]